MVARKKPDTCALGPFLVTADEVAQPDLLDLESFHNGSPMQQGNTRDLIFKIPFLIAFISAMTTLLPGDVIATGTPAGIGSARNPPVLLKPGDLVEMEIKGLGRQSSPVVAKS